MISPSVLHTTESVENSTISILETDAEGSIADSVNKFLEFNEYKILEGYGKISRQQAKQKVFAEYAKFNKTQRIESDFDKETKALLKRQQHKDKSND